jgi:hypothetical protein
MAVMAVTVVASVDTTGIAYMLLIVSDEIHLIGKSSEYIFLRFRDICLYRGRGICHKVAGDCGNRIGV